MSLRARLLLGTALIAVVLAVAAVAIARATRAHLVDQVDAQLQSAGRGGRAAAPVGRGAALARRDRRRSAGTSSVGSPTTASSSTVFPFLTGDRRAHPRARCGRRGRPPGRTHHHRAERRAPTSTTGCAPASSRRGGTTRSSPCRSTTSTKRCAGSSSCWWPRSSPSSPCSGWSCGGCSTSACDRCSG